MTLIAGFIHILNIGGSKQTVKARWGIQHVIEAMDRKSCGNMTIRTGTPSTCHSLLLLR